ncbi:MAG: DUF6089 family protein [Bacteroidota bacterium]|nr:DUF6089 family protein [Bacteroidota bacterium]
MHRFLFLPLFLFCFICVQAQDFFHDKSYADKDIIAQFGVTGGAMNCLTDLGGKSQVFKTSKPAGGFYIGALYQQTIGARLQIVWGSVGADDKYARDPAVRQRNLNFASTISEISLLGEFHPLSLLPSVNFPVSPYLLAGVGTFSFSPYTQLNGATVFLQPLHTEGEGFPETGRPNYKLTQFMIPVGAGLSYQISPFFTVKGELIYRFLNTDYLDDVSTSYIDPGLFDKYLTPVEAALAKQLYYRSNQLTGNSSKPLAGTPRGGSAKDAYYTVNITVEISLNR